MARINRAKDYQPSNCRWITAEAKIRRRAQVGVRRPSWTITAFGETKGPTAWTRDPGCTVTVSTLKRRIERGDAPEDAITVPPDSTRKPGAKPPPPSRARRSIDWGEAKRLLLEEGLSQLEISRIVGASYTGIIAGFKRLGITPPKRRRLTSTPEGRRLHKVWCSLHSRCRNPDNLAYPYYGAMVLFQGRQVGVPGSPPTARPADQVGASGTLLVRSR